MSAPDILTCGHEEGGSSSSFDRLDEDDRLDGHEMPPPPQPAMMSTSFPHAAVAPAGATAAAAATPQCGNALRQETEKCSRVFP